MDKLGSARCCSLWSNIRASSEGWFLRLSEMASRFAARDADNAARAIRDIHESSRDNGFCADCSARNPEYLNLTIGTFVCELCADVHRSTSNRRIKDMFGRDLTGDDVRRMRDVGNEVANRKFLARWNPNEFPEPDPTDKEMLREFIWLKYEGSWKRSAAPIPSSQPLRQGPRDYGSRAPAGRPYGEPEYGREHRHFREPPRGANPAPKQSYWADRYGHSVSDPHGDRLAPGRPAQETEYNPSGVYHQQRLNPVTPSGSGYRRRAPPPRSTAYDGPSIDEEYASLENNGVMYHGMPRRGGTSQSKERRSNSASSKSYKKKSGGRNARTQALSSDSETESSYSSSDGADPLDGKRSKARVVEKRRGRENGKASKNRSRRSEAEVESESEGESDDGGKRTSRRGKKKSSASYDTEKKKKKKSRSRRTKHVSSDSEDSGRSDGQQERHKSSGKGGIGGANPFASDEEGALESTGRPKQMKRDQVAVPGGAEFDLMSEWMGTETDPATIASSVGNPPLAPAGASVSSMMQPGHHQVQPVMPPMSVYPGMMPMPMNMFPPHQGGMMMHPGLYQPPMQYQPQGQFTGHVQPQPPQMMGGLVPGMQNMGMYVPGNSPGQQSMPQQPQQGSLPPPPPPPPPPENHVTLANQVVPPRPAGPPPPE